MNRENTKRERNEKGFTMIELIIVVAIMGIIGAVLVPTFNNMSAKARLSTDITSVKTIQRQLEIYKAEKGNYPTNFDGGLTTSTEDQGKMQTIIGELVTEKYLDSKDLDDKTGGKYEVRLQTAGKITVTGSRCVLDINNADYKDLIDNIDENNKVWVHYSGT